MQSPFSLHSRITPAAVLLVTVLYMAACAPVTLTPASPGSSPLATQPRATARASVATNVPGTPLVIGTSAPGTVKPVFAGIVKHAGQPVANAKVELRPVGWASSRAAPVATIQADSHGAFSLADPPAGDFSVIGFFPDGEMDAGGWPPVSIAPGQAIQGFIVPLERRLTLLAPIADATTGATPALSWVASPEATSYRVWVIDAGTTEILLDETATGTSVQVTKDLKPGEYQWVVNGLNAAGELVATAEETFRVQSQGAAESPTATGSAGATPTLMVPTPQVRNMPRLPDQDRAFEGAREALAKRLGVDPLTIQRVEVTPTEWNDACLGVSSPGQMCAQVITPGWVVTVNAGGQQYEAHTNQDGTQVRIVGLQ